MWLENQVRLLYLQRHLQETITRHRKLKRRAVYRAHHLRKQERFQASTRCAAGAKNHDQVIANARQALHQARRVGDVIAFIAYRKNPMALDQFSRHSPNPPLMDSHGIASTIAVVRKMTMCGLGIPVIHDISHRLRKGDVSFLRRGLEPLVAEIKSKRLEAEGDKIAGSAIAHCLGTKKHLESYLGREVTDTTVTQDMQPRLDARGKRQVSDILASMKELSRPHLDLKRPEEGPPSLVVHIDSSSAQYHYRAASDVLKEAKANRSHSATSLDGCVLYVALYRESGFESAVQFPELDALRLDSLLQGLKRPSEIESNFMLLGGATFDNHHDSPTHFQPSLMLDLPHDMRCDLLRSRLILMTMLNLGSVAHCLCARGLDVRVGTATDTRSSKTLIASAKLTLDDGRKYRQNHELTHQIDGLLNGLWTLDFAYEHTASILAAVTSKKVKDHIREQSH